VVCKIERDRQKSGDEFPFPAKKALRRGISAFHKRMAKLGRQDDLRQENGPNAKEKDWRRVATKEGKRGLGEN